MTAFVFSFFSLWTLLILKCIFVTRRPHGFDKLKLQIQFPECCLRVAVRGAVRIRVHEKTQSGFDVFEYIIKRTSKEIQS